MPAKTRCKNCKNKFCCSWQIFAIMLNFPSWKKQILPMWENQHFFNLTIDNQQFRGWVYLCVFLKQKTFFLQFEKNEAISALNYFQRWLYQTDAIFNITISRNTFKARGGIFIDVYWYDTTSAEGVQYKYIYI